MKIKPMFLTVCLCFLIGFAGCKGEEEAPPAEEEKITPQVEETIPPSESSSQPAEGLSRGSQETE